ncbi:hypothetical protein, partial [Escherichia coli]|uniref:hypothetical protein n=1 Tax=Escherichia coli TaxID=562 RepID=UPI001BC889CB
MLTISPVQDSYLYSNCLLYTSDAADDIWQACRSRWGGYHEKKKKKKTREMSIARRNIKQTTEETSEITKKKSQEKT